MTASAEIKLLVDMNLSPRWIAFMTRNGIDAVHWSMVGKGDAPDVDIVSYAHDNDLIILTHDLDFGAILSSTRRRKPSVVQIRGHEVMPDAIGRSVLSALRQMQDDLAEGALVTIDPQRLRLTILPLRAKP